MEEAEMAPRLPDDALAAILRRLPQRTLAASRRVCRAWRAVADARGLLRPRLLPHAVRGIVVNFRRLPVPALLRAALAGALPSEPR
ncbi:hypothetical protein BAE44_0026149 [Dichanthelium oligosanthes]|uniref:F-box domain-containing protein n=1 Tax=Dichanthelium oligosanthes TaxID=888268 RepID=A0A1E5UIX7_9POAL|nr:hypothetical protein BAE44_0026149 [Dichanthelium oligosanthes]